MNLQIITFRNPDPCHLPAGQPTGGQFTSCPGTESPDKKKKPEKKKKIEGIHFYHGTSSEYLNSIKKHGLVPRKGRGGDYWAEINGLRGIVKAKVGDRTVSVYMTNNFNVAEYFANLAAEVTEGEPVILRVVVPKEYQDKIRPDEKDNQAVRFKGKILPEWITGEVVTRPANSSPYRLEPTELGRHSENGEIFIVALVDNGQDLTWSGTYHVATHFGYSKITTLFNPNHKPAGTPEGGQFTSGPEGGGEPVIWSKGARPLTKEAEKIRKKYMDSLPYGDRFVRDFEWKYLGKEDRYNETRYNFEYIPRGGKIKGEPLFEGSEIIKNVLRFSNKGEIIQQPATSNPDYIYRGMSFDEWNNSVKRKYLESEGKYNFEAEKGLTLWSKNIDSAISYAGGFAPAHIAGTFNYPGIIVAIPKSHQIEKEIVPGGGLNYTATNKKIPVKEVREIFKLSPNRASKGEVELVLDKFTGSVHRGNASEWRANYDLIKEPVPGTYANPDPCHLPAGTPEGGQFTACPDSGSEKNLESIASKFNTTANPVKAGPVSARVYRVGNLDDPEIYFAGDHAGALVYGLLHEGETAKAYDVKTKNTLVAQGPHQLYSFLNNGKSLNDAVWLADKESGFKSSKDAFRVVQRRMMGQARSKGYDSILYKSPPEPAKTELVVIKKASVKMSYIETTAYVNPDPCHKPAGSSEGGQFTACPNEGISEKGQKWIEKTKEEFKTTDDFNKAGYILPDGNMLDFSGGKEGRSLDHREIYRAVNPEMDIRKAKEAGLSKTMMTFMKETGAIRFQTASRNRLFIHTEKMPTAQQYETIKEAISWQKSQKEMGTLFAEVTSGVYIEKSATIENATVGKVREFFNTTFEKINKATGNYSLIKILRNPDPCHVPAGSSEGGQFTACPGEENLVATCSDSYHKMQWSIFKNPSTGDFKTIEKEIRRIAKSKGGLVGFRFIKKGKNVYAFSNELIHAQGIEALVLEKILKEGDRITFGYGTILEHGKTEYGEDHTAKIERDSHGSLFNRMLHETSDVKRYSIITLRNPDPCHLPAGSPKGGQFTACPGGPATEDSSYVTSLWEGDKEFTIYRNPGHSDLKSMVKEGFKAGFPKDMTFIRFIKKDEDQFIFSAAMVHAQAASALVPINILKVGDKVTFGMGVINEDSQLEITEERQGQVKPLRGYSIQDLGPVGGESIRAFFNPCHAPAGQPEGGQFTSCPGEENLVATAIENFYKKQFSIFRNPNVNDLKTIVKEQKEILGGKLSKLYKDHVGVRFITKGESQFVFSNELIHSQGIEALAAIGELKEGDRVIWGWGIIRDNGKTLDLGTGGNRGIIVNGYGQGNIEHFYIHDLTGDEENIVKSYNIITLRNPDHCHQPAGTPEGGQFTSCPGGSSGQSEQVAVIRKRQAELDRIYRNPSESDLKKITKWQDDKNQVNYFEVEGDKYVFSKNVSHVEAAKALVQKDLLGEKDRLILGNGTLLEGVMKYASWGNAWISQDTLGNTSLETATDTFPLNIVKPPPLKLWHGTAEDYVKSIKEKGLIPRYSKGGDYWAEKNYHVKFSTDGARGNSVFLMTQPQPATIAAQIAAEVTGGHPVVIRVEIPAKFKKMIKPDTKARPKGLAVMFVGEIKPEWIKEEIPAARILPMEEEPIVLYLVALVDGQGGDTPQNNYHAITTHFNPCHVPAGVPEGGQFTACPETIKIELPAPKKSEIKPGFEPREDKESKKLIGRYELEALMEEKYNTRFKCEATREEMLQLKNQLDKIPLHFFNDLKEAHITIDLVKDTGITAHPYYKAYRGVTPRGWEGTGKTWDDLDGAGPSGTNSQIIFTLNKVFSTRSLGGGANTIIHEVAHGIDVTGKYSKTPKWKELHQNGLFSTAYEKRYPEESFAEAFTNYYHSQETRGYLERNNPEINKFIAKIEKVKLHG